MKKNNWLKWYVAVKALHTHIYIKDARELITETQTFNINKQI